MSAGEWLGVLASPAPPAVALTVVGLFAVAVVAAVELDPGRPRRAGAVPFEMCASWRGPHLLSRLIAGGRAVSTAWRHRAEETADALRRGPLARPAPPRPAPHGVIACLGCGEEWVAPPGSDPATELVEHMRTRHAGDEQGATR